MAKTELSAEAKAARNLYQRKWNEKNREKIKAYRIKHWEKVAQELAAEIRTVRTEDGETA